MAKKRCGKCGKEGNSKTLKRIKKEWLCKKCYEENREQRRENITRNVLKISKEQEKLENESIRKDDKNNYYKKYNEKNREKINKYHREYSKKRYHENKEIKIKTTPQKIKGSKIKIYSRQSHNYLTKTEKFLLYKKYLKQGLNSEEINKKLNKIKIHLKEFVKKLQKKKESEESIDIKFKEEFAKLIEQD